MPVPVEDIPLFKGLSAADLGAIKACLREKEFKKGQILFTEGACCSRIFFVRSGRVKVYRLGSSGREQILQMLGEGDTCACNPGTAGWSCASTAETLAATSVWFLSASDYTKLLDRSPSLARSLNKLFAERIRCLNSLVEEVSLKDTRKRLVKFLLDLAAETGGNIASLSFTREELAQRLGMTRETVERQIGQLKKRSLIDVNGRKIAIRNEEALKKLLL